MARYDKDIVLWNIVRECMSVGHGTTHQKGYEKRISSIFSDVDIQRAVREGLIRQRADWWTPTHRGYNWYYRVMYGKE